MFKQLFCKYFVELDSCSYKKMENNYLKTDAWI